MNNLVRRAALACLLLALICGNSATGQHPTLPFTDVAPYDTLLMWRHILDMDNLPATNFTCKEKVIGGYYADIYTGCQMFHVCTLDEKGEIHDYKFRCLMGTVFDQETRVCERADDVDCSKSESFFHLNNDLYGPGIIPSTADTSDTSSAATVQVLDPTHALMGVPDPQSDLSATSEAPPSPPSPSPTPVPAPPPAAAGGLPAPSSSPSDPQASPQPQSLSQSQPQALPTSSPLPPVIPPGVTASSTRMSTSTSSSVTAAYSFPPLPFTVSRTSTSVSASSRVHIQTPLAQISLRQGVDASVLPAPHLRPSLLRLAAQAQSTGQGQRFLEALEPTSPSPVTAQTPPDFEDIPRLTRFQTDASAPPTTFTNFDDSPHRQKRQTTTQGLAFSSSFPVQDQTLPTESVAAPSPRSRDRTVTSSSQRVSSRGRVRFRQTNPPSETVINSQTTRSGRRNTGRASDVDTRPRVTQNTSPSSNRRVQTNNLSRPTNEVFSQVVETTVARQQEAPVTRETPAVAIRQRASATPRPQNPRAGRRGVQVVRRRPVPEPSAPEPSQVDVGADALSHPEDPTQVPPTVMTTALPPDSFIRISDTIDDPTAISEHVSAAPSTTTQPPFVFPETSFSCHDKIPGGLYADVETGCVVFHICSVEPDSSSKDNKFVCGVGTLFDQTTRTCQAEDQVDCARSPSLYYLNDPLRGPVFLELEGQLPEQQFDFPRIPVPDSQNSRRVKRDQDAAVDLCRTRPLGTPLADLTSQCHDYTVCEESSDGGLGRAEAAVQEGLPVLAAETALRSSEEGELRQGDPRRDPGLGRCEAEPPRQQQEKACHFSASVTQVPPGRPHAPRQPGPDPRRRGRTRASRPVQPGGPSAVGAGERPPHDLYRRVHSEHASSKGDFPKKVSGDGGAAPYGGQQGGRRYGYISRSKRDVNNVTVAEQVLRANGTKIAELTSSAIGSPTDVREEIRPNPSPTSHPAIGVAAVTTEVRQTSAPESVVHPVASTVTSAVPSLLTTLSTLTITGASTRTSKSTASTTTVTVTPFTVTITTTETKLIPTETALIMNASSGSPTSTLVATDTTLLPTMTQIPEIVPHVNSAVLGDAAVVSSSPSETKPEAVTPVTEASSSTPGVPQEASISQEVTTTAVPDTQNTTTSTTETEVSSNVGNTTVSSSPESSAVETPVNPKAENTTATTTSTMVPASTTTTTSTTAPTTTSTTAPTTTSTTTPTTTSTTAPTTTSTTAPASTSTTVPTTTSTTAPTTTKSSAIPESVPEASTTTTTTTVASASTSGTNVSPPEDTKPALEDASSANVTATTSQPPDFIVPEGSVNVSTTVVPGEGDTLANGTLVQPTPAPTTVGTFTRDNLPETSFTCKNKQLEQFYPDPEANCQVFHYCSSGFVDMQVLDLKFLCTGTTMFNINTQKCEDMGNVTCGFNDTTTTPPPPVTEPSTISIEELPATPEITTSSTTTEATTTPTGPALSKSETEANATEAPSTTTGAVPIPLTAIGDPSEAPATTTAAPTTTTEAPHEGHHNWNATEPDVKAAKNDSLVEKTAVIEAIETTTLEPEVREVTEVDLPETETVTDRVPREEVSTSTEGLEFIFETTTEYFLGEEPEINTELGPIAPSSAEEQSVESSINSETSETPVSTTEPVTELPADVSTQESISPQTPAPTEGAPLTEVPLASEELESSILSIARNASESNHTASTSAEASQTEAAL
ncbi:LOW QUALITY PROTEIN: mucin-2-like [Penaeus chinensis]|uniref:LOW QUALITY PROTEIN: mucin-2-like n=1 Tax=Penaeus chinensis TaxID=139456 RepID=UPI001FB79B6F|nr:LOW QUALITY PROTEIN: mucin-2-like [Penaeus chinensis]